MSRGFKRVEGGINTTAIADNADDVSHSDRGGSGNGSSGDGGSSSAQGVENINPAEFDGGSASGSASEPVRKRRGRKPGATAKQKVVPLNVNAFESILLSVHDLAADLLRMRSLRLEEREAKDLANAVAQVAEHYGVGSFGPWGNLALVASGIYGRRLGAVYFGRELNVADTASKAEPITNGAFSLFGTVANGA